MIHTELASGRWYQLTLMEQLGNIGSEVSRAIKWRGRDDKLFMRAIERALELFDLNARAARLAIERVRDENLGENWSLLYQGSPIFTMPRAAAVRTWFFSHMIHHRAILTVSMRLNNIPVPGIYGPSADEQM